MKNIFVSKNKNKLLWLCFFILIALGSIWAITASNENFSFKKFTYFIKSASPIWVGLALVSIIFYILCEGWAITCICKSFGHKGKKTDGLFYSAADIYFSAITPSASGGQPASAYFMMKDNISIPVITVALFFNLLMYSVSILLINIIMLFIQPSVFLKFSTLAKIFIFIGFICQLVLIVGFYLLLYREKLLYNICSFLLKILMKLHLVSNSTEKIKKLDEIVLKYQKCAKMIKGKRKVILKVLMLNIFQRIFQISVVICIYLATTGNINNVFLMLEIESLVILGSYCVPIPGSIGVTDYLMINGFNQIMLLEQATNLELFSRGLSFYFCIFICGIATIIKYILVKRSSKI